MSAPNELTERVGLLEVRADAADARLTALEAFTRKLGVQLLRMEASQQESRKAIEAKLDKLLEKLQPQVTL